MQQGDVHQVRGGQLGVIDEAGVGGHDAVEEFAGFVEEPRLVRPARWEEGSGVELGEPSSQGLPVQNLPFDADVLQEPDHVRPVEPRRLEEEHRASVEGGEGADPLGHVQVVGPGPPTVGGLPGRDHPGERGEVVPDHG